MSVCDPLDHHIAIAAVVHKNRNFLADVSVKSPALRVLCLRCPACSGLIARILVWAERAGLVLRGGLRFRLCLHNRAPFSPKHSLERFVAAYDGAEVLLVHVDAVSLALPVVLLVDSRCYSKQSLRRLKVRSDCVLRDAMDLRLVGAGMSPPVVRCAL
mgnify:CR=1 FL=1